jgi:hypothetical protein
MPSTSKEARVILALEAIKNNPKLAFEPQPSSMMCQLQRSAVDAVASLHDAIFQPTHAI